MNRPGHTRTLEMRRARPAKLLWVVLAVAVVALAGWSAPPSERPADLRGCGRVRVTYREGLQWGSHEAGPPVTVTFLSR